MFGKEISLLTFEDIQYLVETQKAPEGTYLDYKKQIDNPDKAKKELAKDISAFANSGGGYLIIGIDNDLSIVGTEKTVQNKPVVEWINQVLSTNVEPAIFYLDPKLIEIPENEKVIVVIYVPESTKKPHMVNEGYNYYIRVNDSCKPANHNQVRDMFEFSKNRTDEFNQFLKKRNLFDEDDANFGINANSKKLYSSIPEEMGIAKPFVLFSLIPKFPNEEKLKMPLQEFRIWLDKNSSGYKPLPNHSLYYATHDLDCKLDGIVMKRAKQKNDQLCSYFEILNSGYVESGFSQPLTYCYEEKYRNNQKIAIIYISPIIAYVMQLLGFAKNFYKSLKYYDEVLLQISFVNVLHFEPYGFYHREDSFRGMRYDHNAPANRYHTNFKINTRFNPKNLTTENILQIGQTYDTQICRAFGLNKGMCFGEDELNLENAKMHYCY